jgi:YcaO cyclodehydratase, ATP-ad Mg2+-binding
MTSVPCSVEWGERSLPPEVAVAVAARECGRLGLTATVRRVGSPPAEVVVTELVGPEGIRAFGSGKGDGLQMRASADFEALERFFTVSRRNTRFAQGLSLLPLAELAAQPPLAVDCVVQRWASQFPDRKAAASEYRADRSGGALWYPLFLNDPRYYADPVAGDDAAACRTFLRYTSSIGTAAGVNPTDARLHALCELIEHDSISHALLRWFVLREREVAVVDAADLPPDLARLYDLASTAHDAPVLLVDVTTELGVPTCLAVADAPTGGLSVRGSGASTSGRVAVARALHEVIQDTHVEDDDALVRRRSLTLAPWPVLADCYGLTARRLTQWDVRKVPVRPDPPGTDTPPRRLRWLDARLAAHAIPTFSRELAPAGSHVSVVATVAPALDRFSLVLHGTPVLPTGRAFRLWRQTA